MENQENYINALILLHQGLKRLGPGDDDLSKFILSLLPELPENPTIVDIGCGTGSGSILLAKDLGHPVLAQDMCAQFLEELEKRADTEGVGHLVRTEQGDMGNLGWPKASVNLLWSEGAAYNLTFEGALKAWYPLMAPGGIAVISELSYFSEDVPDALRRYWESAYPAMAAEAQNCACAAENGFEIKGSHRLRSKAWWDNYYAPLNRRMGELEASADSVMQSVIEETRTEMSFFDQYSEVYGYTFYILKAE